MTVKAMYVLSGDPLTNGHIDIVKRARETFGSLLVALAINPGKKYTYDLQEREGLTRKALLGLDITIDSYSGHTIDYAKLNGIKTIIRSARGSADFDFEKMLNDVGKSQEQGIETVLFFARQNMSHISSSAVKELQRLHGSIHEYVPFVIKESLEKKISNQRLIGLTGEIGAGKSFVAQTIISSNAYNTNFHEIDMDKLGHEILSTNNKPMFIGVRENLIKTFGVSVQLPNEIVPRINIKALGSIIFSSTSARETFNALMSDPMLTLYREKLIGLEGTIFVSSALFAEAGIGYLTNHNVILVHADKAVREQRLYKRGYSSEEVQKRMGAQLDYDSKREILRQQNIKHKYGTLTTIDNTDKNPVQIITELESILHVKN